MFIVLFIFTVNVQFNVLEREIYIIRMLLNWKPAYIFVNAFLNLGVRKGDTDTVNLE